MIKDVEVLDIKQKRENGMSIADIARETGYCEKTVRKWLKADAKSRYKPRPKRPSKLGPGVMVEFGEGPCGSACSHAPGHVFRQPLDS